MQFARNIQETACRLSHWWISQKWHKLGSPNLHHRLPGRLRFTIRKAFPQI